MSKVAPIHNKDGSLHGYAAHCPACGWSHLFDSRWSFNGDLEKPTFSPSMLVYGVPGYRGRCHSFLKNGIWEYLSDCEHKLKDQHIPVPDFCW